jgi:hypothetical protein
MTTAVRQPDPSLAQAAARRADALLAQGRQLLGELDRRMGDPIAAGLPLVDAASADAGELQQVSQQLVPLMQRVRPKPAGPSWWRWFTGERLEQQILFDQLQRDLESLVESGERLQARLKRHAQALQDERVRLLADVRRLEVEAGALRLLLQPPRAEALRVAGLDGEDLDRLSRRAANLDTLASAAQLSRGQYKVTIAHLLAVADRFVEVRALLLPLWKQAMGFELFARRVAGSASLER